MLSATEIKISERKSLNKSINKYLHRIHETHTEHIISLYLTPSIHKNLSLPLFMNSQDSPLNCSVIDNYLNLRVGVQSQAAHPDLNPSKQRPHEDPDWLQMICQFSNHRPVFHSNICVTTLFIGNM